MSRIFRALVFPALLSIMLLACADSSGPSATENYLSGATNIEEIPGLTHSDIYVYLVEFGTYGPVYVDTSETDYLGEYEFRGFDNGWFAIYAETKPGVSPHYRGFRDNNRDGIFDEADALNFSTYAHLTNYNVPLYQYGSLPDTTTFEFEPNDDIYAVQDLDRIHTMHISGDVSSGGFDGVNYTGDHDFFRFESIWDGNLLIDLRWAGSQDLDLYLYDSFGEYIDSAPADWSSPNTISKFVYRDSEYVVLVVSADYSSYYELSIQIR